MTFEVFVDPIIFDHIPADRRDKIKKALLDLKDPLPGENKKEIKGSMKTYYRLRVGKYRILYIREQDPLKGRTYFLTVLKIHPESHKSEIKKTKENNQQKNYELIPNETQLEILRFCVNPHSKKEIMSKIEKGNTYHNFRKNVSPLIEKEFLAFTTPDAPHNRFQKYMITKKGAELLEEIKSNC